MAPKMTLMYADETTHKEWQEQIRISTLGFMHVANCHHNRLVQGRTKEITDLQTEILKYIDTATLKEGRRKPKRSKTKGIWPQKTS